MEVQKLKISEQDRMLVSVFMDEEYPLEIDFNWLMPVVERTENICNDKEKEFRGQNKDLDEATGWRAWSYRRIHLSTDINEVWLAVVEFIKFWNQNKTQQP